MDEIVKEAALEWVQVNISPAIRSLSEDAVKYVMDKDYPTGYDGFHADITAGFKS